jgi:DNA topoisomerase-2
MSTGLLQPQISENSEINNLVKVIGLKYKKKYETERPREDMRSLRYGKVMVMADQDQDGSHIKGLAINFFHHNWPTMLKRNFLEEFITPIVKVCVSTVVYYILSSRLLLGR